MSPKWVDAVEQVEDDIREIDEKMESLKALQAQRVMAFDDSEAERVERQISAVSNAITGLFKRSEKILKQVVGDDPAGCDGKVRANIRRSMAKNLQERSSKFRSMQKDYMGKLQSQKAGSSSLELDFLVQEQERRKTRTVAVGMTQQQLQVPPLFPPYLSHMWRAHIPRC